MSQSYIWPAQVAVAPIGGATAANQVLEIADLDAIKASTASIDTKTRTLDVTPATQNITVQDTGSTTTPVANGQNYVTGTPTAGSAATFNFTNYATVKVQVTGTWTGTLISEKTIDGITWLTQGIHQSGTPIIVASFTANFSGGAGVAACTGYRIRATGAMTGTANVKVVESASLNTVYIGNAVTVTDGANTSNKLTIKPASTAPLATDPSVVVAISPNSPTLPVSGSVTVTQATGTNLHTVVDSSALPTGAATSALQTSGNASLTTIAANTPAVGQALMAASTPVVIASNQSAVPVSGTVTSNQGTANATPWNENISQIGGTPVLAGNGLTGAGSLRVTIASDTASNSNAFLIKQGGKASANAPVRNDYTSVSVSTAAYTTLVASLTSAVTELEIFDSSGQTLVLATGAAASEVNQVIVFPGGNGRIPLAIAAGVRVSIKALSATANVGEIDLNFYG